MEALSSPRPASTPAKAAQASRQLLYGSQDNSLMNVA
jgi:hypothetical protein